MGKGGTCRAGGTQAHKTATSTPKCLLPPSASTGSHPEARPMPPSVHSLDPHRVVRSSINVQTQGRAFVQLCSKIQAEASES